MHQANLRREVELLAFWCLYVEVFDYKNQKNKQLVRGHAFPNTTASTKRKRHHAFVFDECGLSINFRNESLRSEVLRVFPVVLITVDGPQIGKNFCLGRNCVALYLRL